MLKKFYEDEYRESYTAENGTIIAFEKDNSIKKYYRVFVNVPNGIKKTVATRCTYEKAMQIAKEYDKQ